MAAMTPFSDEAIIQTLQAMPEAVLAVDSLGVIAFANHHVEDLTGYSRAELVGKSVDMLVPTSRREAHTHQRSGYQEAPSAREMGARRDLQLRTKSGSLIPVTISLSPLDGSGDGVILATVRDVSSQERRSKEDILVAEIGRIVTSGLEIQGVYEAVAESIPALVKYDRLAFNLNEPASGLVNRVFVSGVTVPGGEVGTSGPPPTDALTSPGPLPGSSLSGVPVGSDPLMKSMAAAGLNSWVEVPLGNPDEPIGYLSLRSFEKNAYSDEDLNTLVKVAAHISPAIENGLLYAQAQREAHENATLAEISRIITSVADINDVYSLVAEQVQEIVPFDRIVVATIDRSRNLVTDRYVAGLMVDSGESNVTYPLDDSTVGYMEKDLMARSLNRDEVEDLATRYPADKSRLAAGLKSMLTTPLIWNDEVIGRLIMRSMRENAYGDAEAVIAVRIANQISGAVANAALAERTLRDSEEQAALAEISRIITSTSEIEAVYDLTAEEIRKLVPFDRIVVSLIDQSRGLIVYRYVSGIQIEGIGVGSAFPLDGSLTKELIKNHRPKAYSHFEVEEHRYPGHLSFTRGGLKSMVIAPLIWDDKVIARLALHSEDEDAYDEDDALTVQKIANQIAGAVANAELVEKTLRDSEEQAALAEISRIITSTSEIEEVYDLAVEQIRRLIPFDRIVVSTVDRSRNLATERYVYGLQVEGGEAGSTQPLDESLTGHLTEDPRPRWFNAAEIEEFGIRYPRVQSRLEAGLKSQVVAPLIWDDEVIGSLSLRSEALNAYGEEDALTVQKIANQISGAVANAELVARTSRESEESATLAEISRIASSAAQQDDAWPEVASRIAQSMSAELVEIQSVDMNAKTFKVEYIWPQNPEYLENIAERDIEGTVTGRIVTEGEARVLDYTMPPEEFRTLYPNSDDKFPRSLRVNNVIAPLHHHGQIVGVLNVWLEPELEAGVEQVSFVVQVANQISGQIANEFLFRSLTDEVLLRESLAEISRVITSTSGIEEVFALAVDQIRKLVPFDRIVASTIDRTSDVIIDRYVAGIPMAGGEVGATHLTTGSFVGHLIDEAQPVWFNNSDLLELGERYRYGERRVAAGIKSLVGAPLIWDDETIGFLTLHSREDEIYSEKEAATVQEIANQISGAVANAETAAIREREVAEKLALNEIGRSVGSTLDFGELGTRTRDALSPLIAFDRLSITLIDEELMEGTSVFSSPEAPYNPERFTEETWSLRGMSQELAVTSRGPVSIGDHNREELGDQFPMLKESFSRGLRSAVTTPVLFDDRVIAGLSVQSNSRPSFSAREVELLDNVALQIGPAIANAQSHVRALEAERAQIAAESEKRELELLEEQRANFLSTVSHELKTPLTSIVAFADILARNRDSNLTDRQLQQIDVMQKSSRRLDMLINDLLDISNLDAGTFAILKQEFEVKDLIDELRTAFGPVLEPIDQSLKISESTGEIWIEADRDRVAQVIMNLLNNASKYSLPGTEINLGVEAEDGSLAITVSDSGIGMSEETLDQLFTPFYRSTDEHTQSQPGSGLGMAIVKSILELHDGTIEVSSKQGTGTTVRVLLPDCRDAPSEAYLAAQRAAQVPVSPVSRLEETDP